MGVVSVTTALPGGGTQTGEFFKGEFVLTQGRNGRVVATLAGGNFSTVRLPVSESQGERAVQARAAGVGEPGGAQTVGQRARQILH